jgi:hypothetical protein
LEIFLLKLLKDSAAPIILFLILILGCREDIFLYPAEDYENFVYVNSDPVGASIFLKGVYLEETTPAWIRDLEPGNHLFTLKLQGYVDTTFRVSIKDSASEFITVHLRAE